jgi:hypothetical protein
VFPARAASRDCRSATRISWPGTAARQPDSDFDRIPAQERNYAPRLHPLPFGECTPTGHTPPAPPLPYAWKTASDPDDAEVDAKSGCSKLFSVPSVPAIR